MRIGKWSMSFFFHDGMTCIKYSRPWKGGTFSYEWPLFISYYRRQQGKALLNLRVHLLRHGFNPKDCQCCGDGVSEWIIRDPNYGLGHRRLRACNLCVDFYDRRCSKVVLHYRKKGTNDWFTLTEAAARYRDVHIARGLRR